MQDKPVLQLSENQVLSGELLVSVKVETQDDVADDNCYNSVQEHHQQYENMPWSDGVLKRDSFSSSKVDSGDSSHLQEGNISDSMWKTPIDYEPTQHVETSVYGLPSMVTRQALKRRLDRSDVCITKCSVPCTKIEYEVTASTASSDQNCLMKCSTVSEPVIRNSPSIMGCSSQESRSHYSFLIKQPMIK